MSSGRFAMAAHALALLATAPEQGWSSAYIAGSVNTQPAFLRRILRQLAAAGLILAREGRGGGYRLAREPGRIWLDEAWRAVEGDAPLMGPAAQPSRRCPIGRGMRAAFASTAASAEQALLASLARKSVADLAAEALRYGGQANGRSRESSPRAQHPMAARQKL